MIILDPPQTSVSIVGTLPAEATKFVFSDGALHSAVTYIKTGENGSVYINFRYKHFLIVPVGGERIIL